MKVFKNQKGFSLVEAVVSMFLLTIVLLCVGAHAGVVIKQTTNDKNYSVATVLIQDKMEQLKQVSFDNVTSGGDSILKNGNLFYRTWTVTPGNGNLKTVNLIIDFGTNKTVRSSMTISQ